MTSVKIYDDVSIYLKSIESLDTEEVKDIIGFTAVESIKDNADRKVKRRSGLFAGGIGYRKTIHGVVVGDSVKYGIYLEEGTRPHIIKPKRKKMLYWKTAEHPVKMVRHPGTRAYRIFEEGVSEAIPLIVSKIYKYVRG